MAQAYPWSARAKVPQGGMAAFPPGKAPTLAELSAGRGVLQQAGGEVAGARRAFIPSRSSPASIAGVFEDVVALADVLEATDPNIKMSTDLAEAVVEEAFPDAPQWVAPAVSTAAHMLAPEVMGVLDIMWMAYQLVDKQPVMSSYHQGYNTQGMTLVHQCPQPGDGTWLANIVATCGSQYVDTPNVGSGPAGINNPIPAGQIWSEAFGLKQIDATHWGAYGGTAWRNGPSIVVDPRKVVSGFVGYDPLLEKPREALTPGQLVSLLPYLGPLVAAQPQPLPWKYVSRETSPFRETGPARSPIWRALPLATEALRLATLTPPSPWGQTVPQPWLPPSVDPRVEPELFQQILRRLQDEQRPPFRARRPRRRHPFDYQYPWQKPLSQFKPPTFGPPKLSVVCEKKIRVPKALIHGLAASTYAGGTIRNLFKSLPPGCRSRNPHRKKRKYSSMLADVEKCWRQIDWRKFAKLETEMLLKYAIEGYALSVMNRVSSHLWQGALCRPVISGTGGLGLGTAVMHAQGPTQAPPTGYGGPFAGRHSPFELLDWLGSYWES